MSIFLHDIRVGPPVSVTGVDMVYADVPYGTGRKFSDFSDTRQDAVPVIRAVVQAAEAMLRPGGVVVIQSDHHLNWMVRVLLEDSTLEFFAEVIWSYNSGGAGQSKLPQKHDTLCVFAKPGARPTFNVFREPYPRDYGGRPGFHPEGRMATSVWQIPILSTTSTKRTGYSTEKPPALIQRVLETFSPEGGTVYDPCCGSGATGVAARACGRTFALSDINPRAIEVATARLA